MVNIYFYEVPVNKTTTFNRHDDLEDEKAVFLPLAIYDKTSVKILIRFYP